MCQDILEFKGFTAFLCNFYPSVITIKGKRYATVEHAYQVAKFSDEALRDKIRRAPTPGAAKRQAWLWPVEREDWDEYRLKVMARLLRLKAAPGTPLALSLLATDDGSLAEGNHWKDTFWGVCSGEGENHLGLMLMEVRGELGGHGIVEDLSDL